VRACLDGIRSRRPAFRPIHSGLGGMRGLRSLRVMIRHEGRKTGNCSGRLAMNRVFLGRRPPGGWSYWSSTRTYSTTTPLYRRPLLLTSFFSISLLSYTFGSLYPPPQLSLLFPRPAPGPSSSHDSPSSIEYTNSLERALQSLRLLYSLRSQPDADEWYETRPYTNYPEERRVNNLSAGALRGPGKLALRPLVRSRKDEKEAIVFIHVGRGLCGHDGIIHGGLLATLLDESLARTVGGFFLLPYVCANDSR
jgi:hypothetical protein